MRLSEQHRQRIILRHRRSIQERGYGATALYWSNTEAQQIRFEVLASLLWRYGLQNDVSRSFHLLDVGAGFGDFHAYLVSLGANFSYTGIDVSPDMVQAAGLKYSQVSLRQGELFDFDWPANAFDFVVCSGAMNEVVDPPGKEGDYAKGLIRKMYCLAKYGVAFNLLNAQDPWTSGCALLQSFIPQDIQDYSTTFASQVVLEDGYLPNDFSVYLGK
ncbi:MAG: class I SAM-dependent methyltransferase [Hydrogenovibrio sp.]